MNYPEYNGITLKRTCFACPEQYEAVKDGKQVGYLRLRHGYFYAECPDVGGEMVYQAAPYGIGSFADNERERYLTEALFAISDWTKAFSEKNSLLSYMRSPQEPITARNRMGCSEAWYDPYYAIKQTFTTTEIEKMSSHEIANLVKLAKQIAEGLY